jgi:hypothetical protein
MASARGLGGNIPFGSSFSSWGGTLEVKPVDWHYTKMGLYMSFPNPTDSNNNGLMFLGDTDVSQNGLFFLGETGVKPRFGADELPGKYAFGGYYYGEDNEEFGSSKFGFYWQADQMIWLDPAQALKDYDAGSLPMLRPTVEVLRQLRDRNLSAPELVVPRLPRPRMVGQDIHWDVVHAVTNEVLMANVPGPRRLESDGVLLPQVDR